MGTVVTKFFEYGQADIDYLRSVDPVLGAVMTRMGKVERVVIPDLFTALIYSNLVAQADFKLEELYGLSDQEVVQRLMTLKGIGKWTAEMMLINCMERPDIISWGDIAIRRGMVKLYGLDTITKDQFEQYRLTYSPLGSVASIYLWEISFE